MRFYKTDSANPIDYMYRIPGEMMVQVLQSNEAQIDNIVNTADLYNNSVLKIPHLTQHNQEVADKQNYYGQKANEITSAIAKNPMEWKRYQSSLKDLGRELQTDMTTGDLAKVSQSHSTLKEFQDKYKKALDKGEIDRKEYETILNSQLSNFTGYDPSGSLSALKLEDVTNTYNLPVYFEKLISKMKADGELNQSVNMGQVLKTMQEQGWEGLKQDKVMGVLYDKIMGDPALWGSINQRVKYNVPGYQNIYGKDDSGNDILQLMKPTKRTIETKGPDGKTSSKTVTEYTPYDNILSRAFFGTAEGASWSKTKNKSDVDYNPTYLQDRGFAQQERMAAIQNSYKVEEEERKARGASDTERRKAMENLAKELSGSENPEDVARSRAIFEGLASGRPLDEIVSLPAFMVDVPNPSLSYESDINSRVRNPLGSETEAIRQRQVLSDVAKEMGTRYGRDTDAMDYMRFLDGRKSTEALAQQFVDSQRPNLMGEDYFMDWISPSNRVLGRRDEYEQLIGKLTDVGNNYNTSIDRQYQTMTAKNVKSQISPIDELGATQVRNLIAETPQYFYSIGEGGKEEELNNNISKVIGVTGGNNHANMGYYVQMENGTRKLIFPKEDQNVLKENMYYAATGLAGAKGITHKEMSNPLYNYVHTTIQQGVPSPQFKIGKYNVAPGLKNILTLGSEKFPVVQHPDGSITVISSDGNQLREFESINKFLESLK